VEVFEAQPTGQQVCTWLKSGRAATDSGSCLANGRPYAQQRTADSVDGKKDQVLCVSRTTTCEGLNDYSSSCSAPDANTECGVAGVDDGYCKDNGASATLCTIPCVTVADCKPGATCTVDNYCSL